MNKLKQLLNTSLLSNRHKQCILKNQKGDIDNPVVGDFSTTQQALDNGVNVSEDDAQSLMNKWILKVDRGIGIELMHRVETAYSIRAAYSQLERQGYNNFYIVGIWAYDVYYLKDVIDGICGVILIREIDAGDEAIYTMFSYNL